VLRPALDELHAAFADAALRDLTHGDLSTIGWKLVTTLGSGADVSYFLPRLLEAIAENARDDEYRAESVETLQAAVP
jgi:hypothetical protein